MVKKGGRERECGREWKSAASWHGYYQKCKSYEAKVYPHTEVHIIEKSYIKEELKYNIIF